MVDAVHRHDVRELQAVWRRYNSWRRGDDAARRAEDAYTIYLFTLDLPDAPPGFNISPEEVPITEAERAAVLRWSGGYYRQRLRAGNLADVVLLWRFARIVPADDPWPLFGLTNRQARTWLEQYARQLYHGITAHPRQALDLLQLHDLGDDGIVAVLGAEAAQHIVQTAIKRANREFRALTTALRRGNLKPATGRDRALRLGTFVRMRYLIEVRFQVPGYLSVYSGLDFDIEALNALEHEWYNRERARWRP